MFIIIHISLFRVWGIKIWYTTKPAHQVQLDNSQDWFVFDYMIKFKNICILKIVILPTS